MKQATHRLSATVFVILAGVLGSHAYTEYNGTMNDFLGVNVHQQLWQYHYLGTNTNDDMHIPFRWVRNYHPDTPGKHSSKSIPFRNSGQLWYASPVQPTVNILCHTRTATPWASLWQ
jgi:hypothetical protein